MKNDVTYLAIILGLFALAFLLVAVCDRIIGPDDAALDEPGAESSVGPHGTDERLAA